MELELSPLLQRFAERMPLPVMAKALLHHCFEPDTLDRLYKLYADKQYENQLLFSDLFALMTAVVLRQQKSVRAAYYTVGRATLGATLTALYDKLAGLELSVLTGLLDYNAERCQALLEQLAIERQPLLAGVSGVRILDGNVLQGRQHRLKETRNSSAAPLPGKSLAVLDPERQLILQWLPCADGHTQERALFPDLLTQVKPGELWMADRNFCTTAGLFDIEHQRGYSLIREHGSLRFQTLSAQGQGYPLEGGMASEQQVAITQDGETLVLRRIRIQLDKPTRDGETTLYLLSTVPASLADAATLAGLYRRRWSIETAFQRMTTELRCEVDTLAYPGAALFGFCVAALVFNVLSVLLASLAATFPQQNIPESFSTYFLSQEMANSASALDAMLEPGEWDIFAGLSTALMVAWLCQTAAHVKLEKYPKTKTRKHRSPAPVRIHNAAKPHVSVDKLLRQRKMGKKSP